MKTKLALFFLVALVGFSCSDDPSAYTCKSCSDSPDAVAANDATGKGIYKGLVVGSSGTITFNISNTDANVTATLTLDGKSYTLHTESTYTTSFNGTFYGKMISDNDISIPFYASGSGGFELGTITIPGHPNVSIEIYKELSTNLVTVFEGTFSGAHSGTLNIVTKGDSWIIRSKEGENSTNYFTGTIKNGTMTCPNCGDVVIEGKISGDVASGTWVSGDESGTWKGKRTL